MALIVGIVPVISGLLVMSYLQNRKLEENSIISAQEAIFAIDRVVDNLHGAALLALPLSGLTCDQARPELDAQARSNPRVHSLMLTRADHHVCSTLPGEAMPTAWEAENERLQLSMGSTASPNGVLLQYRLPQADPGVIANGYGLEVINELRGFQDGLIISLELNDQYIWGNGDSRDLQPPSQSEFQRLAASKKYGYQIRAGYPAGYTRREVYQSTMLIAPSLALIGLLSAVFAYWGVFRKRVEANTGRHSLR